MLRLVLMNEVNLGNLFVGSVEEGGYSSRAADFLLEEIDFLLKEIEFFLEEILEVALEEVLEEISEEVC